MKTCKLSILGGSIARALLGGLPKEPVHSVARHDIPQASFSLRRAYRRERGMWNGATYETRCVATGGLLVWVRARCDLPPHSKFYRGAEKRIRPADVKNAEQIINGWATDFVRSLSAERQRLDTVDRLDKRCAPYLEKPGFHDWVAEQEKELGESDYSKLTIELCAVWEDRLRQWAQSQGLAWNVNPSGQAGIAWSL